VLTLITGEKLVVLEPCGEVSERILDYRAAVLRRAWPESASSFNAKSAYDADHRVRDQAHHASAE
jgi:flagellar protein FlbD